MVADSSAERTRHEAAKRAWKRQAGSGVGDVGWVAAGSAVWLTGRRIYAALADADPRPGIVHLGVALALGAVVWLVARRKRIRWTGATGVLVVVTRVCFGVFAMAAFILSVLCSAPEGFAGIHYAAGASLGAGIAGLLLYGAVRLHGHE